MRPLPPRMQDRLYHDFMLSDETQQLATNARAFALREVAAAGPEIAANEESPESFPVAVFSKLAEEGWFGVPFPKEVGGLGLKYPVSATVAVVEELAYMSNSVAAVYDAQCILAGHALMFGSQHVRDRYLRPMIVGDKIGCFATSEPGASTDLSSRSIQTTATRKGNKYVVNGQKRFITNSPVGNFVTALANLEGQLTMFVIDLHSSGCKVGRPDKKMGNHGQLTADIYFEDVEVPGENLIGEQGHGLRIALATLTYGRIGIGASGVGMAQAVFDECVAYLQSRQVFGKKVGQFQHWQFKMAERAIQIENARNLYIKAALRMDQGEDFPEPEAAGAKYYGTECAVDMARDGVQIFGGYGFLRSLGHDQSTYKVQEVYADAKISEIYEGTNEIQKLIVARTIFGKDFTG